MGPLWGMVSVDTAEIRSRTPVLGPASHHGHVEYRVLRVAQTHFWPSGV